MNNEVKLSVGSTEGSVYLLRTVAASIAARLDFSLDDIDDLTLAVSEAAAFLVAETREAERLSMRVAVSGRGVEVILTTEAEGVRWPPENVESSLAWKVLSALTDRAQFVAEPEGPAINLLKQRSSAGSSG